MDSKLRNPSAYLIIAAIVFVFHGHIMAVRAWTGEIHGRVVCDVCGDSSISPEDHVLAGQLYCEFVNDDFLVFFLPHN